MRRNVRVEPKITGGESVGLADVVWDNARRAPDAVQFRRPDPDARSWPHPSGDPSVVTCRRFRDDVLAVARGLVAAGLTPGSRVALMSRTRYEWTLVDYAVWTIGAVTVPVYDTSSAEQLAWILADSGAVACVVELADHAALLADVRHGLPELRQVWQIDSGDLIRLAEQGRAVDDEAVERRRAAVSGTDLATIVYTSGTTGRPKGCVLTHRNIHLDVGNAVEELPELFNRTASTVLFLPLAHAFARMIQVGMVQTRATMVHSPSARGVLKQLRQYRPTFVLAVPRVFERAYNTARQQAAARHRGWLFDVADQVAVRYSRALDMPPGPGTGLRLLRSLLDVLVYRKLRAAFGGRCRVAVVGGAHLGERLGHFFRGAGLTILEGYGLTETSPALAVNRPSAMRVGTVGRPLPGVELAVADGGEILVRSAVVFRGYWNNPAATSETFTADGWLRTGDLGSLDDDGYLRITGRTKEIMVTAEGKNITPAPVEDRIRAHPLISQSMLIGDGKPYVAALVTIDPQAWSRWRDAHGHPRASVAELRDDPALRDEIQTAIDQANHSVSHAEAIKTFRILPDDFTEANGELTPTLKIRREVVQRHRAADIATLYRGH
ncbi:AMP-dependent synthetase/ligase [Micromonospora olivasterospora]|uniref:Acyl-CoA synthetase n=1 Tax=Micromonospora olivasterospora TaxID=1880 RepID=A0A562IG50_MICOL|nr:AMP-dependent synthetase/ligase [Micromonospora olivasterospora]TWH69723.1 long-chain acyl-CoA synthetase [Micromonospora olivasterospora]